VPCMTDRGRHGSRRSLRRRHARLPFCAIYEYNYIMLS
jgi:hypothetical protein